MRKRRILLLLALGAALAGCAPENLNRLFRPETIIEIPVNPETQPPPETEAPTELPTELPTEAPTEAPVKTTTTSRTSGSSKTSGSKAATPVATEPPATLPPETEPPATEDPAAWVYDISGYSAGDLEWAVAEGINARRAEAGLGPLTVDGTLGGVASVRAYEASLSWSHIRPDGREWQTVLSDYGWSFATAAEELAHVTGYDAASVVSKWMEAHEGELLDPGFTTVGVGAYTHDGTTFLCAILLG